MPMQHIFTNKTQSSNFKTAALSLSEIKFLQICIGLAQDKSALKSRNFSCIFHLAEHNRDLSTIFKAMKHIYLF